MTQTLAIPNLDPKALQAGKLELEKDTREAAALVITDRDTYAAVGAVLRERLRELDAAEAFREKYTKPAYKHWKDLCELLSTEPHKRLCAALKKAIGDYDLREATEKAEAAKQARELVAAQGPTPDVAALTEALTVANAPQARAEGVSTQLVWKVKRVVEDLLPDAYWTPSLDAIQAEAERQGVKGDEPPVIPGVVFEREASVTGRR